MFKSQTRVVPYKSIQTTPEAMRGDIEHRIDILVTQMSTRLSDGLKSRLNA